MENQQPEMSEKEALKILANMKQPHGPEIENYEAEELLFGALVKMTLNSVVCFHDKKRIINRLAEK